MTTCTWCGLAINWADFEAWHPRIDRHPWCATPWARARHRWWDSWRNTRRSRWYR